MYGWDTFEKIILNSKLPDNLKEELFYQYKNALQQYNEALGALKTIEKVIIKICEKDAPDDTNKN